MTFQTSNHFKWTTTVLFAFTVMGSSASGSNLAPIKVRYYVLSISSLIDSPGDLKEALENHNVFSSLNCLVNYLSMMRAELTFVCCRCVPACAALLPLCVCSFMHRIVLNGCRCRMRFTVDDMDGDGSICHERVLFHFVGALVQWVRTSSNICRFLVIMLYAWFVVMARIFATNRVRVPVRERVAFALLPPLPTAVCLVALARVVSGSVVCSLIVHARVRSCWF